MIQLTHKKLIDQSRECRSKKPQPTYAIENAFKKLEKKINK